MNKPEEFVLKRIASHDIIVNDDKDKISLQKTNVFPVSDYIKGAKTKEGLEQEYKMVKKNNCIDILMKSETGENIEFKIKYDNNAQYEYCTTQISTHDGTLIFQFEAIKELLVRIFTCSTYNKETAPNDYLINQSKYITEYTIGDIVIVSYFGIFDINGRMIPGQRDIVCLPISVKYIEHKTV